MTVQKSEIQQAKANALKTVRAAVRLRHSIAADDELNTILPKVERAFDKAVHQGELPDPLTMLAVLEEN